MEQGVYSANEMVFIPVIRSCIVNVCDAAANLRTISKRNLSDATGGAIYDTDGATAYQNFVFHFSRLHDYCREFLPKELSAEISEWISRASISENIGAESKHIETGLSISEKLQEHLYDLGLKDTTISFDVFPFKLYKEINDKRKEPNPKEMDWDPKQSEEPFKKQSQYLEDGDFEIIGFSSKSEYSFLYTSYCHRSFWLLSEGRTDDARTFFYNIMGDFAPVFDETFLENCIEISKTFLETTTEKPKISKRDYHQAYLMHKAEFSRLMIRANIHQQPDIIDTKKPDFEPAKETVF